MTKYVLVTDILRELFYHNGEVYLRTSNKSIEIQKNWFIGNMIIEFTKKKSCKIFESDPPRNASYCVLKRDR